MKYTGAPERAVIAFEDALGNPVDVSSANALPTTGGGGGGGGSLSDTVFVDSTGQLFVYRDTGSGTPNAYAIPAWTLYTPVGTVSSASAGNAAASATGAGVPGSADYIGFNSGGNLVGVSSANPLPVDIGAVGTLEVTDANAELLLMRILNYLNAPQGYDKSLQALRITGTLPTVTTVGTVTTVTTVTTCSTVTNLSTIDTLQGRIQVLGQNLAAWSSTVRARIT
jgi:hypothetical protein